MSKPANYGATSDRDRSTTSTPTSPRTPTTHSALLPDSRFPRRFRNSPGSGSAFSTETGLTHAEQAEYERGLVTWEQAKDWRFWLRWHWVPFYAVAAVVILGVCAVAVFHREIIHRLMPLVIRIQNMPFGWLIPIVAIIVLSFPPLFGNEIIIILCGVVWGVQDGFLIVATGTVLGEMACFTVYGTCCRRRAKRLTHMSLNYACLTRVISNGGLFIAWVVRLSAIPTHVSTLLFAVCGLPYSQFLVALVFSLPKQFVAVYLGVMVTRHEPTRKSNILSYVVVGFSVAVTLLALHFVHRRMLKVRKDVFRDMKDDLARRGVTEPSPPETDDEAVYTANGRGVVWEEEEARMTGNVDWGKGRTKAWTRGWEVRVTEERTRRRWVRLGPSRVVYGRALLDLVLSRSR